MSPTLQQILTLQDAAAYLRLPEAAVQRRAARGEIPGQRIEGSWRFLRSALEDWLRRPRQRAVREELLRRKARDERDLEILNRRADELNREVEDVLEYQVKL